LCSGLRTRIWHAAPGRARIPWWLISSGSASSGMRAHTCDIPRPRSSIRFLCSMRLKITIPLLHHLTRGARTDTGRDLDSPLLQTQVDGPGAPYRQSERGEVYTRLAKKLVDMVMMISRPTTKILWSHMPRDCAQTPRLIGEIQPLMLTFSRHRRGTLTLASVRRRSSRPRGRRRRRMAALLRMTGHGGMLTLLRFRGGSTLESPTPTASRSPRARCASSVLRAGSPR
jgi:hypothetical protein